MKGRKALFAAALAPAAAILALVQGEFDSVLLTPRIPGIDVTPPTVNVVASTTTASIVDVSVKAADSSGISKVFVSLDGLITAGRTQMPYEFSLSVASFPVELCAVADDRAGNSAMECEVVQAPPFGLCDDNSDCIAAEFCEKAVGDCGGAGSCRTRPQVCTADVDPVCGCNGQTYSNSCVASAAGVSIAHAGIC